MSSKCSELIFKEINNKGMIILNRPKVLNALSANIFQQISFKSKEWNNTKSLVLVKSIGGRAFSAGGDIRNVYECYNSGNLQAGLDVFRMGYTCINTIKKCNTPVLSLINGITMGGGVGLAIFGKYRIATERTLLAMPEARVGLIPDGGASYYFPRMPRNLGVFLGLTGYCLKGWDVVNSGIATHFCRSDNLRMLEESILLTESADEVEKVLQQFHQIEINPGFSLNPVMDKIEDYFSEDKVENIMKKLIKDESEWAKLTKELLKKASPTSLKFTLKALQFGKNLGLEDCLKMEFNLNSKCVKNKNFHEGIRALLIDKDKQPKWDPLTVEQISDEFVDMHFKQTEQFDLQSFSN